MFLLKKEHSISLVLLSLFGIALTFAAFITYKNFENEKLSSILKERAEDRVSTFQGMINNSLDEMESLSSFFYASEKVERNEFHQFCQTILFRQPGLQALEWIPGVPSSHRLAHEKSARNDGLPDYRITERKEQGVMVAATNRDEYYPVYYIEPQAGNELALGYDMGSEPVRRRALQMAMDSGKLIATPRITLVQEQEEKSAFLVFLPIYRKGMSTDTVEKRRKAHMGFVLGVFRVSNLLESAMSLLSPQGIDMYIYDESERIPDRRFLSFHPSRTKTGPFEFKNDEDIITQGLFHSLTVNVADRKWKVYCVPSQDFIIKYRSWLVWGVPVALLLFFAFVISYLAFLLERVEKTKLHAKDLANAKNILEQEVLERQRTEELVRKERDRAKTYLDISGVIIIALNTDQTVKLINRKGCEILGYDASVITGRNWFTEFIPESGRERVRATFDKLVSGNLDLEQVEYFENPVLCKNGTERYIAWHNSIIYGADGEIEGTLSSGEDITDRKRAEKERVLLEARLRHAHKLESIGTLAGGIAHDFNNILTIIIGNAELARLTMKDDSRTHDKLVKVINASERAKDLVKQILSFSRKVDPAFHPVKPHVIVKDTINMLRSTIPATIDIQENIDNECGTIVVDPTQINQILLNLCTNAVHAMQEKGSLGIELSQTVLTEKDLSHMPDMAPGKYARLSVSDTGTGIPPETLDRVFDPFFTTKRVGEGTGMGLSMVHGIVMSHKGMITIDSELDKGSIFHIFFPVFEGEEAKRLQSADPIPTGTENILFIDDEFDITELAKFMLEQQGFSVVTKTSSLAALDYIKCCAEEIDLVITDQSMPEMSGTELTAEIRKIMPEMPIVLCTGFSTKVSSEEEARLYGISEFILKPLDQRNLATIARKALDGKQGKMAIPPGMDS